jgi:hypothetical protein
MAMFSSDAVAKIDRSAFFLELYGEAPEFEGVHLHEFAIVADGPTIRLRFSPRQSPRLIPKKWQLSSFNAASVELEFIEIRALSLTKFAPMSICTLHLTWQDGSFTLVVSGDIEARVVAEHSFVQRISGYQRSLEIE